MTRRLLNFLAALSLLLFVALAIVLPADADSSREVEYVVARAAGGGRVWGAYCQDYTVYLGLIEGRSGTTMLDTGLSIRCDRGHATRCMLYSILIYGPHARRWFGFGVADYQNVNAFFRGDLLGWQGARVRVVMIPSWFVLAALAIMPGAWMVRRARQWRRPKAPLCASCAYDLTANVSGVCPECGQRTVIRNPEAS